MVKKILATPGVLLPLSLLTFYTWRMLLVGNNAMDVTMHNAYTKGSQINLTCVNYWLPVMVSWLCYTILAVIKPPNKKWTWAQVTVSILCLFILNNSFNKIPRRYYDYEIVSPFNVLGVNTAALLFCVWVFMLIQMMLWVYCLRTIIKAKKPN